MRRYWDRYCISPLHINQLTACLRCDKWWEKSLIKGEIKVEIKAEILGEIIGEILGEKKGEIKGDI